MNGSGRCWPAGRSPLHQERPLGDLDCLAADADAAIAWLQATSDGVEGDDGRDAEPGPGEFAAGSFLRHLGIYAYRAEALQRWVRLAPGRLERMERSWDTD